MKYVDGDTPVPIGSLVEENPSEAVMYVEQTLSETQKAQARANIGVANIATAARLGDVVGTIK